MENREAEIERLSGMLRGGRPPEALAAEGARESNERLAAHLNIQVHVCMWLQFTCMYVATVYMYVYRYSVCMWIGSVCDVF